MADTADRILTDLRRRRDELRPLVTELERIEAAIDALERAQHRQRRRRRPARRAGAAAASARASRTAPTSSSRSSEGGTSIPAAAQELGIGPNYLYRIANTLEGEGTIRKEGREYVMDVDGRETAESAESTSRPAQDGDDDDLVADEGVNEGTPRSSRSSNAVEAGDSAFVTGGSGFIGGRLIARLTREGVRSGRSRSRTAPPPRSRSSVPNRSGATWTTRRRCARARPGASTPSTPPPRSRTGAPPEDFERINVEGTNRVLRGDARGGRRALRARRHRGRADRRRAAHQRRRGRTAPARLEVALPGDQGARRASRPRRDRGRLRDDIVRPRFVWGPGDTTVLPSIVEMVEKGKFAFIGGGKHQTDTTHVDNIVEGLVLAADKGEARRGLFRHRRRADPFREWMEKLLAHAGVEAPGKSVPRPVAGAAAAGGETIFKLLRRAKNHRRSRASPTGQRPGMHDRHSARARNSVMRP